VRLAISWANQLCCERRGDFAGFAYAFPPARPSQSSTVAARRIGTPTVYYFRTYFDRLDGDRFSDQKYLEQSPARFPRVAVIRHKGANVAGWNFANWNLSVREGRVWIDEQPRIFFHFASFQEIGPWWFNTSFGAYLVKPLPVVRRHVFGPYLRDLKSVAPRYNLARNARVLDLQLGSLMQSVRKCARLVRDIAFRQYIVFLSGRVW